MVERGHERPDRTAAADAPHKTLSDSDPIEGGTRVGKGARVRIGAVELIMPLPGAPKPSLDEPGRLPIPLAPV